MENNEFSNTNNNEYSKEYSESSFWDKVKNFASKAGSKVIYAALKLYYTLVSPDTPAWAKTAIIAALGYFIAPIDFIPDITPVVGFTDDLAALGTTLVTVSSCITPDIIAQAKNQMKDWFGKDDIADLD